MKIIILAGGSGTRLWPVSRETFPKQFLKLGDQESLLQKTVKRFLPEWSVDHIFIVTQKETLFLVKNQMAGIDPKLLDQIIVEPERKNTGPAIALAIRYLQDHTNMVQKEIVFVCTSDHWIEPKERFLEAIKSAEKIAMEGRIVTFGVRPSKPETGYGYIQVKKVEGGLEALSFTEKPPAHLAEKYLLSGDYLWNSGMFVLSVQTFWQEVSVHCPELKQGAFENLPNVSIDYAIMEKSKRISVVLLDLAWSDIGSWDAVFDVSLKDLNQNVQQGNVVAIDTKNSLLIGGKRLIVAVGLENVLVIETEDALYLGKRGQSQRVKAVVEFLKKLGHPEMQEHLTVHRPWGHYMILEEGRRYKVKRIFVAPQQKLSLQMHHHRSEHWVVIKGTALASIGESKHLIHENESMYVPKSTVHRLENPGKVALELIEVQVGEYVGEDDIVRFDDIYGRNSTTGSKPT